MKRFTNLALAGLLTLAIATGLLAQGLGTGWSRWATVAHGVLGLAFLLLVPWKSQIAKAGLKRRRARSVWSVALVITVVTTIGSGLLQMTGTVRALGPLTTMQVHVGAAVVSAVLVAVHYLSHPVRPRATDLGRRNLVRVVSLSAVAGLTLAGWESAVGALGWSGGQRRFTGSHERGSGNPAAMPVTQWFTDKVPVVDRLELTVAGRRIGPSDLAELPMESLDATLDCTSGWYSTQRWKGVRLDRLLDGADANSIAVRSVTGYTRRFPMEDAHRIWLAVEMGGVPLSPGHGFPARIVAPGRRGFWWVKWVESVQPSDVPAWFQVPFPLT